MVDFLNNPIAEFNELRIAFTNLVTTKAAEYSETVLTFVSNHSSELLYGSLTAFVVVTFIYLLGKLSNAVYERDSYKWKFEVAHFDAEMYEGLYLDGVEAQDSAQREFDDMLNKVTELKDERRKMQDTINTLREERDAFEADLEEARGDRDTFESNAEYWEVECIDVRNERDELETERDNIEAERDVLLDRIELLQQMANTYKELVVELETPQLRLAA